MPKGFHYTLEKEKLIEYGKLTIEERLLWLEAAFEFNCLALGEKERAARDFLWNGGEKEVEISDL